MPSRLKLPGFSHAFKMHGPQRCRKCTACFSLLLAATCQSSQPEQWGGGQSPHCVAVFGTLECTENFLLSKILQDCNWAWLGKMPIYFVRCKLFHKKLSLILRQHTVPFQLCSKNPCHISIFKRIKSKEAFSFCNS